MSELQNVVGLFGTCGDSTWRDDKAIPALQAADLEFFNPVVADWTPDCMEVEARHAAEDRVILMGITGETTAVGSLAELGWIALQAQLRGQSVVVFLEDMDESTLDPAVAQNVRPNKVRALVREHMGKLPLSLFQSGTISMCETLDEAVERAVELMAE